MNIEGHTKEEIFALLTRIGVRLGFSVQREVNTGVSKVDLVWFDKRLDIDWYRKPHSKEMKIEDTLLIPIVGFEVEETVSQRKYLRGDVDSLNSLYPELGVIVLSRKQKEKYYRQEMKKATGSEEKAKEKMNKRFETTIRYAKNVAHMNPFRRIIVITDDELDELAQKITKPRER